MEHMLCVQWPSPSLDENIRVRRGGVSYHLVHKVLDANVVQNTIGIDEENEKIVVSLEIFGVDFVNELECGFLAMPLASMREP